MFKGGRELLLMIGASFLLVLPGSKIHARVDLANGWTPTALEISKLPNYCQRFFLEKVLPPNCDGVHHLCAGKVVMHRSMDLTIPKPERQRMFRMAATEVNYMFGRPNQQCLLMDDARAAQNQIRSLEPLFR